MDGREKYTDSRELSSSLIDGGIVKRKAERW
jgi:hypothetical protein